MKIPIIYRQFFLPAAALALCAVIAAGCASGSLTTARSKLDEGDRSILIARESYATTGGRADLRYAESKLAQARMAYDDGDYDKAYRLADEASVEAEYARVAAAAEKARMDTERMRADVRNTRMRLYPASSY